MKRVFKLCLWMAMCVMLSACITEYTPTESVVELQPGEAEKFTAISDDATAKLNWYLDGKKVACNKTRYSYTAEENTTKKVIIHKLVVKEEGGRSALFNKILDKDFVSSVQWIIKVLPGGGPVICYMDEDGDGFGDPDNAVETEDPAANCIEDNTDCDDDNAAINPEADEVCDGLDNNCNGTADDGISAVPTTCGVGACAGTGESSCVDGELVDNCVPGDPSEEVCDAVDNDCDGLTDEDISPVPTTCGVGACASTGDLTCVWGNLIDSCVPGTPTEEIPEDGIDNDCDGEVDETTCVPAQEVCDGIDNDCDGVVDNDIAPVATTCGVGECAGTGESTCVNGQLVDSCVEGTPAAEVCDGLDNDCNGSADDGIAPVATTCGVGECAGTGESTCVNGQLVDSCVEGTPAAEECDGLDNDCNGTADDGIAPVATTCGIGACAGTGELICSNGSQEDTCEAGTPSEEIPEDGIDNDCDGEVDETTCVPAQEVCDGIDNDCDGVVDNDIAPVATTCGVGECAGTGESTCVNGQLVDSCVEGTPAAEVCDGLDNDCNGSADDGIAPVATTCGVGECAGTGESTCVNGQLVDACVEGTPAAEVCDGLDNDCNGTADDGIAPVATTCGIGACAGTGELICSNGSQEDTCEAGTPSEEIPEDGIDNDCDGEVDETTCVPAQEVCDGIDNDCDGVVDNDIAPVATTCGVGECAGTGESTCVNGQLVDSCVEGTPAAEVCDGLDNDCNGTADDGIAPVATTCGIGACAGTGESTCVNGQMVDSCVAGEPTDEVCDGLDNNCDGIIDDGVQLTFFADVDGDTYGNAEATTLACEAPEGYVADSSDCDDTLASVNPGAEEVCNGIDDNCNDEIDEGVQSTFYADSDDDDFGNAAVTIEACEAPDGYVADATDCDDGDDTIYPGATEIECDDIDQDCDGSDLCEGPPAAPQNVQATDLDSGLTDIEVTWDASSGADTYNVYRAIFNEDGAYELVGEDIAGTSFSYAQTWDEDVAPLIGENPGLAGNPTNEDKLAFINALNDYRDLVLPVLFDFKAPAYFKVEACNASGCSEWSVADAGRANYIHTEDYSEAALHIIPTWGYAQLIALADAPVGPQGLSWCGIDLCGSGGGIAMGRVLFSMTTYLVNVDVFYNEFTEVLDGVDNAYAVMSGSLGGAMQLSDANAGHFWLTGDFDINMNEVPIQLHMYAEIGGTDTEGNYFHDGYADLTYNGATYQFSLPIQAADDITGHAANPITAILPARTDTGSWIATGSSMPSTLIESPPGATCQRNWTEYSVPTCSESVAP